MKGIHFTMLSFLACCALTVGVESAVGPMKHDAYALSESRVDVANLWTFNDEPSFKLDRRGLADDTPDYYGCDGLTGRKCRNSVSCTWIKPKGEPGTCKATTDVECGDFSRRGKCSKFDGCYWAGKKDGGCLEFDEAQECSEADSKKICDNLDECTWVGGRKNGECKTTDDIECSDYDGKKGGCSRMEQCVFIGRGKNGECKALEDIVCSELNFKNCRKTEVCSWEGKKKDGTCEDVVCSELKYNKCKKTEGCSWVGKKNDGSCEDED